MRTRQQFDADLVELNQKLVLMGQCTSNMLDLAVKSLVNQDASLALSIEPMDDQVDQLDLDIEAECMRLVIQQQPLAHDLRFVGMVFQAITDIERIADHAVDISKIAIAISHETHFEPLVDIKLLGEMVRSMFAGAMEAFASNNVDMATKVVSADDPVDDLFHEQRAALLSIMQSQPLKVKLASHLIFVAQFLERIGDRSVNIAERVHQIEKGERSALFN